MRKIGKRSVLPNRFGANRHDSSNSKAAWRLSPTQPRLYGALTIVMVTLVVTAGLYAFRPGSTGGSQIGQSTVSRKGFLVAVPVDFMSAPAFLIAARSFVERLSAIPGAEPVRFAMLAGNRAWREVSHACSCYLPAASCDGILHIPDPSQDHLSISGEAAAEPRWTSALRLARDMAVLARLTSCSAGAGLESEAVLVLPDPHVMVTRSPSELLQDLRRRPETVLVGDRPGAQGRGLAPGAPLLVHTERWQAQLREHALAEEDTSGWSQCPVNGKVLNEAAAAFPPAWVSQGRLRPGLVEAWAPGSAGSTGGVLISPPSCPLQAGAGGPVLLRMSGESKPWEGLPEVSRVGEKPWQGRDAPATRAELEDAESCSARTVRREAQRLLECRYDPRPGLSSADYERLQYVWYYRDLRTWFLDWPRRPRVDSKALQKALQERVPPYRDGLRVSDFFLSLSVYRPNTARAVFADKTSVKHFARVHLGEGHTVDTLGLVLPNTEPWFQPPVPGMRDFALKASSMSGTNAIVVDGKMIVCTGHFDAVSRNMGERNCKGQELSKELYQGVLRQVSQRVHMAETELQYVGMRRSLILEKLYEGGAIPADYKFFCSRGTIMYVLEVASRYERGGKHNGFFSPDWTFLPDVYKLGGPPRMKKPSQPPSKLAEMVRIAQQLSEPFPFVRVDLFEVNGKVYLGEMTFTPAGALVLTEPIMLEETAGRIVAHHLPEPKNSDGWQSGFGAPPGTVLTQEQVTRAMMPLTMHDPNAASPEQLKAIRRGAGPVGA